MGKCSHCRWWDPLGSNVAVICGYCRHDDMTELLFTAVVVTHRDFGCIYHEEADDE